MKRLCALVLCSIIAVSAQAQVSTGDSAHGYVIATEFCAQCHIVTDPQAPPLTLGVPSFFDIANASGTTALSLKAFFGTPHQRMPDYIMHPSDIDDIIAYILGLRGYERRLPPAPPALKPVPKAAEATPTGAAF
jgi:mono/diheme cytochrome c family protein